MTDTSSHRDAGSADEDFRKARSSREGTALGRIILSTSSQAGFREKPVVAVSTAEMLELCGSVCNEEAISTLVEIPPIRGGDFPGMGPIVPYLFVLRAQREGIGCATQTPRASQSRVISITSPRCSRMPKCKSPKKIAARDNQAPGLL